MVMLTENESAAPVLERAPDLAQRAHVLAHARHGAVQGVEIAPLVLRAPAYEPELEASPDAAARSHAAIATSIGLRGNNHDEPAGRGGGSRVVTRSAAWQSKQAVVHRVGHTQAV